RSCQEFAVLVGVSVDRVIEKVAADTAVIEECIALAGRTITGDRFPFPLHPDQKIQNLALGLFYLFCERKVGFQPCEASFLFSFRQLLGAQCYRTRIVLLMPRINSQRAAMRWQFFDVEDSQAEFRENLLHS